MFICWLGNVYNESENLKRLLPSIKSFVSTYVVSIDDRTTDDSEELIRHYLGNDGVITRDKWVDFSHNRNLVLERARGLGRLGVGGRADYGLIIDADEELEIISVDHIHLDLYQCEVDTGECKFLRNTLIRLDKPWYWYGRVHNSLMIDNNKVNWSIYPGLTIKSYMTGAKGRGLTTVEKYSRDAEILTEELKEMDEVGLDDPKRLNRLKFLAQSYFDSKQFVEAVTVYQELSEITNTYKNWYMLGKSKMLSGKATPNEIFECFDKAFELNENFLEPVYYKARVMIECGEYYDAVRVVEPFLFRGKPTDPTISIEPHIYQGGFARLLDIILKRMGLSGAVEHFESSAPSAGLSLVETKA